MAQHVDPRSKGPGLRPRNTHTHTPAPTPAPAAPLDAPTSGGKAQPCFDEATDAPDPLLPNVPPGLITWGDFTGVSQDQICCPWGCARPKDSNHAGQQGSAVRHPLTGLWPGSAPPGLGFLVGVFPVPALHSGVIRASGDRRVTWLTGASPVGRAKGPVSSDVANTGA